MAAQDFCDTIDTWIMAISRYSPSDLQKQPASAAWSIGQVYMHLINDTAFFIEQAKACVASSDNTDGQASEMGKAILHNNSLGAGLLQGPPGTEPPPQPTSHLQLTKSLNNLKQEIIYLYATIDHNRSGGKSKHPGFDYFSAGEWLQFAHIHFRHHLRQKDRLDLFLQLGR